MKIGPIRDRLKAQVAALSRVHGAAEFAAAIQRAQFTKDAYVLRSDVSGGANTLVNAASQRKTTRFMVCQWVRNVSDSTGGAASEDVDDRSDAVIDALLGWVPAADHDPVEYVGGRLLQYDSGAILWADEFRTSILLRAIP